MFICERLAKLLAPEDIYPSDGGYRLKTKSIRATWAIFAGPTPAGTFCITHGVLRTSCPLPRGVSRGRAKECLVNAGQLALAHPEKFTYCEGWAQMPCFGLTTHHAWCLDRKGNVVDPTWEHKKGSEYLGVPIKTTALQEQIFATKEWGFFPHGVYIPETFSANPEAFIESNFSDECLDELF